MATRTWIGDSAATSWSDAANWSGAAVPTTGDDVIIPDSTSQITVGLPGTGVDYASFKMINFRGVLGSSGTSLLLGTITGVISLSQTAGTTHINLGTATQVGIGNTPDVPNSCNIVGGTVTSLYVARARGLTIGGSTITTAYFAPKATSDITATILGTNTLTTLWLSGNIFLGKGATTVNIVGGHTQLTAATTGGNVTTLNVLPGAQLTMGGRDYVVTTLNGFGVVSGSGGPKTVTNTFLGASGTLRTHGLIAFTNTPINAGGTTNVPSTSLTFASES